MMYRGCPGKALMLGLSALLLGGCNIWESYSHPDYQASRADRMCHPYGDCSQGEWVAKEGTEPDPVEARLQCMEQVTERHGNGWWKSSVTHGLEIKECMEKKGYVLRQL